MMTGAGEGRGEYERVEGSERLIWARIGLGCWQVVMKGGGRE